MAIHNTYDMHIKEKLIIFFASDLQMQCVIYYIIKVINKKTKNSFVKYFVKYFDFLSSRMSG